MVVETGIIGLILVISTAVIFMKETGKGSFLIVAAIMWSTAVLGGLLYQILQVLQRIVAF